MSGLLMKNLYVIFIASFLFHSSAFGQNYIPFPDSLAFWNVSWSDATCFASQIPDGNYSYYIGGDTTINSTSYHKIYRTGLCNLCCFPPNSPVNGYVGAFRNDVMSKLILWIATNHSVEDTLYNFNLNVGDTMSGPLASICQDAKITSIDSILLNSNFHKRFHFIGSICEGDLIEGVGSTLGLIEPLKTFEGGGVLNCMNLNHQPIYPDSNTLCDLINFIEVRKQPDSFLSISRDYCNSQFIIKFNNSFYPEDNFHISIYDLNGKLHFDSFKFTTNIQFNSLNDLTIIKILNGKEIIIIKTI
jgi:hypothetical protein